MAKIVEVRTEYAKDKNLKKEDVKKVLDWVNTQPHLPQIIEFQAIAFLKKNHYYLEPTKKNIDTYFTLKKLWPDLLVGRNLTSPSSKGLLDVILHTPLPKKTPEGYFLTFMKILSSDIAEYELFQCLKYLDISIMTHLYQHGTSEGCLMVLDSKIFHMLFYQKWSLMPTKGFHFITNCSYMNELMDLMRSSVPKPMLPFVYVHNSVEDIEKFIPIELLPVDYGGSVESVDVLKEKWEKELLENVSLYEWEDQQVVDEDKRPSKIKGANIFEVENGLSVNF